MRRWSLFGCALVGFLLARSAGASSGHSSGGGKGGSPPGGGGSSSGGEGAGGAQTAAGGAHGESIYSETYPDADIVPSDAPPPARKWWNVEGVFESHRLIRQGDLGGDGNDKAFNFYYLYANFDPTERDRITLRGGAYQRFLADQGESGVRADDLILKYERDVPLPGEVDFKPSFRMSAPTSFDSQKQGLVTAPRLSFELDRSFGDFDLQLIQFEELYVMKYSTAEGGNANPKWRVAATLQGEYHMPFYRPLSVGAAVADEYYWFYTTPNLGPANSAFYGAVADPNFSTQPIQQSYGFQFFVRQQIPSLYGVNGDISVAYGQGDPTLGYTSRLHDGAGHMYLFYRHSSEVYAALTLRY